MLETYKINLNTPVKEEIKLDIINVTYSDNSFILTVSNKFFMGIKEGQLITYKRKLYRGNGKYVYINDVGRILSVKDGEIAISVPPKDMYFIRDIEKVSNGNIRVTLNRTHKIFQQDIEFAKDYSLTFYDSNRNIIKTITKDKFGIPLRHEDRILTKDDCIEKIGDYNGCNKDCITNVFEYVFLPNIASRNSVLIKEDDELYEEIKNARFISFKYNPYLCQNDGEISFYEDLWLEDVKNTDKECVEYQYKEPESSINILEDFYKIEIGLSMDSNEVTLGNEDIFSTKFVDEMEDSLVPSIIDMERVKFSPVGRNDKNEFLNVNKLNFYFHFRKRAEIKENERTTINSVHTSGNVYYDSWHIDEETKDSTWWNTWDYKGTIFNPELFKNFHENKGKTSDLIGYLNFTNNDIFYRKKKVSKSFIRLSFYTSTDPVEQKLLYYSTIFLDGGELYGKYLKQLQFVTKNGALKANKENATNRINENAFVVLYSGGTRVDTKISVSNEYDKTKSSEGFNLYLFADENAEKTIYMRVEFNHAGNGKTTPLISWPTDENGEYCSLTTENFIESLYIPVTLTYLNNRYVYCIEGGELNNNELDLVLYEPKLSELEDIEVPETPTISTTTTTTTPMTATTTTTTTSSMAATTTTTSSMANTTSPETGGTSVINSSSMAETTSSASRILSSRQNDAIVNSLDVVLDDYINDFKR